MNALAEFLESVFADGAVTFFARLAPIPEERRVAVEILNRAYAVESLSLAGPPIPFDPHLAVAAAEFLRYACWFAVNRTETEAEVERLLAIPAEPRTAAHHLSTDLIFRFLPRVHQRARALNATDPLAVRIEVVLRQFPLSGILADIAAPTVGLEFDDHPGLQLLYAERFAKNPRPAWRAAGRTGEYIDRVGTANTINA